VQSDVTILLFQLHFVEIDFSQYQVVTSDTMELEKSHKTKKRISINEILFFCALVGIRTPNLLIRSEMLYPIELQMHFRIVNGLQRYNLRF
jgi:hypothetical protein